MNENNLKGKYQQKYATSLSEGNPEKDKNRDWWDEMCKKYKEKNYHKKKRDR